MTKVKSDLKSTPDGRAKIENVNYAMGTKALRGH